jgi:hypothetical protein
MLPLGLAARIGLGVWRWARPAVLLLGGVQAAQTVGAAARVATGGPPPAGGPTHDDPRSWAQRTEDVLGAVGRTAIVLAAAGGLAYSLHLKRRRR